MIDLSSKTAKKDLKALAKTKPSGLRELLIEAMSRKALAPTALEVAKKAKLTLPLEALLQALRHEQPLDAAQALGAAVAAQGTKPAEREQIIDVLISLDLAAFWKSSAAVGWALRAMQGEEVTDALLVVARAALAERAKPKARDLLERVLWVLRERPERREVATLALEVLDVSEQAPSALAMHAAISADTPLFDMFLDASRAKQIFAALNKRPAMLLAWGRQRKEAMLAGTPEGEAFAVALERNASGLRDALNSEWVPLVAEVIARAPTPIATTMADVADWVNATSSETVALTEALIERARKGELVKALLWHARNPRDAAIPFLLELVTSPEHGGAALERLEDQTPRIALRGLEGVVANGASLPPAVVERLPRAIEKLTPPPRRQFSDAELDGSALAEGIAEGDVELVRRALAAGVGPDAWEGQVPALHTAVRAWNLNEHMPMIAIIEALVAAGFDPREKLAFTMRDDDDWESSWKKGDSPISLAEDFATMVGKRAVWHGGELRDMSHVEALLKALGHAP